MFICINSTLIFFISTSQALALPPQAVITLTVAFGSNSALTFEKQKKTKNNKKTTLMSLQANMKNTDLNIVFLIPAHDMTPFPSNYDWACLSTPCKGAERRSSSSNGIWDLCDILGRQQRTSKLFAASVPTLCQAVAPVKGGTHDAHSICDMWHFLALGQRY